MQLFNTVTGFASFPGPQREQPGNEAITGWPLTGRANEDEDEWIRHSAIVVLEAVAIGDIARLVSRQLL